MRNPIVPDLDQYKKVRSEDGGCTGCAFFKMSNIKCSAIPCNKQMGQPFSVIYIKLDK